MANTIVLLGVITVENKDERVAISKIKGMGLNLAALLHDTLYQLHDGITAKICAREGCTIQALSEQKINIKQLNLQCDELVSQNQ